MSEMLETAPPSAKLVYKVLEHNDVLTQSQIADETRLPPRTVRDALDRLEDREIVSREVYIPDARKHAFRLTGNICKER